MAELLGDFVELLRRHVSPHGVLFVPTDVNPTLIFAIAIVVQVTAVGGICSAASENVQPGRELGTAIEGQLCTRVTESSQLTEKETTGKIHSLSLGGWRGQYIHNPETLQAFTGRAREANSTDNDLEGLQKCIFYFTCAFQAETAVSTTSSSPGLPPPCDDPAPLPPACDTPPPKSFRLTCW